MAKKFLKDVNMGGNGCSTYLGSMAGILEAAGLWEGDFYKLAGMTGIAFHFIVHEQVCPSGVTVYDWQQEHFTMMDRIGVESEVFQYYYNHRLNTYDKVRQMAIQRIKESIDRGIGVVIWAPTPVLEFGIIYGYDDEDQVFFVKDCLGSDEVDPLLYENLGKAEVPILSYQIFYGKKDVDYNNIYMQSLDYAVKEWEKENTYYSSGRKGYDNLINALVKNDYNPFGLSYIVFSYSKAKECIANYLDFLKTQGSNYAELETAALLYQEIAKKYSNMERLIPFNGPGTTINKEVIPELKDIIEDALKLEEKAMTCIKDFLSK